MSWITLQTTSGPEEYQISDLDEVVWWKTENGLIAGQQVWLCSDASAFFDLCPCIAQADRPIEYQFVPGAAINAIITQALKLIFCPALCVPHTRFYFAIVQYL